MDDKLIKLLEEQIKKIDELKNIEPWGPEYKIWNNKTEKLVGKLFGDDYRGIFIDLSRVDIFNPEVYLEELEDKKRFLEDLIKEGQRFTDESVVNLYNLEGYDFHPLIQKVSEKKFKDGYYADAVESAFKEVIRRVKEYLKGKTGEELDGDRLMNKVFGFENQDPIIKFNNLQTQEERDEQKGLMFLFKGIVGIRNRKAHENIVLNDPKKAFEYLALASLLMRLLDEYAK